MWDLIVLDIWEKYFCPTYCVNYNIYSCLVAFCGQGQYCQHVNHDRDLDLAQEYSQGPVKNLSRLSEPD